MVDLYGALVLVTRYGMAPTSILPCACFVRSGIALPILATRMSGSEQ